MVDIHKNDPVPQPATVEGAPTTDYEVGQDNVKVMGLDVHNPVFFVSAVVIVAFVIVTLMFQEGSENFFNWLRPALTNLFDWPLLVAGNLFVLFSLLLVVTPLGSVRLGGPDARPDYNYAGWFAMLFAAGMGDRPHVLRRFRAPVALRLLVRRHGGGERRAHRLGAAGRRGR